MLILLAKIVLILAGLPVLAASGYLLWLTLLSAALPAPAAIRRHRFVFLVPAHNETRVIERTVNSLLAVDYPAEQFRVRVIADNCTDDTATLARAAGAEAWERQDADQRGKGYALRFGYEKVLAEQWADAVVIVDADTEVTPNLLGALSARLEAGIGAVQVYSGVLNPLASWRTELMTIAHAIFHRVRGRARERLGLSNKLNGNGMCFTVETLRRVPHTAFSNAEDLEYTIALTHAGIRIAYCDEAEVSAEMVSSGRDAQSQRQRWEGGRGAMRSLHGAPLLRAALATGSRSQLDLALDVFIPQLTVVALAAIGYAVLSLMVVVWLGLHTLWLLPALAALAMLVLHVLRGAAVSGLGARAYLALLFAPVFVFWIVVMKLSGRLRGNQAWVRTTREGTKDH